MLAWAAAQREADADRDREAQRAAQERKAQGERSFQAWLAEKQRHAQHEKQTIRAYLVSPSILYSNTPPSVIFPQSPRPAHMMWCQAWAHFDLLT